MYTLTTNQERYLFAEMSSGGSLGFCHPYVFQMRLGFGLDLLLRGRGR